MKISGEEKTEIKMQKNEIERELQKSHTSASKEKVGECS